MALPVFVRPDNGQYAATLAGAPDVRATAPTRAAALAALQATIQQRLEQGELVMLELERHGVTFLAGKYRDDPTLRAICKEAFDQRDAEFR